MRQSEQLAVEHFGRARLFDQRRTRRLVESGRRVLEHPQGSLPQKMGDAAATQGLYGLLASPDVGHGNVLEPHRQLTLARMAQHPVVLIVHDATELDYSHIAALQGQLGRVAANGHWGLICHNSLALTPQGQVLGLANQILHRRRRSAPGESPKQKREDPRRESRLWPAACRSLGKPPPGGLQVDLCDRGADTYEFLAFELREGRHFVVRCAKDRNLFGQDHLGVDRIHQKVFACLRDLPEMGQMEVRVQAVGGKHPGRKPRVKIAPPQARPARLARVRVAAGPLSVSLPHFVRGEAQEDHLELWGIHVLELAPPTGCAALEWMLLTDLPCPTLEQAREKAAWYACRPAVEDYHKALKTGMGIEQLQLEQAAHLEAAIALLSVSAAVLLGLRHLAREETMRERPASEVLLPLELEVLSLWRWKERREMSVQEAYQAIARLGGLLNGRPPGWQTLWRGWSRLQDMVAGARAIGRQRSDQS